jgi:methionyl-tRNA synthetase
VFQEKTNTELVGVFGNFLYRTLLFAYKNFRAIPEGKLDDEVMETIQNTIDEASEAMEKYEFKKYADSVMTLASYGNIYFQSKEPWNLVKEDKEECGRVLKNCMQIGKALTLLYEPLIPEKAANAWKQLGMESDVHAALYSQGTVPVESGTPLNKPSILFKKIEDETIEKMEAIASQRVKEANEKQNRKKGEQIMTDNEEITFEDFGKLDMRVGTIVEAEKIEKADKLLRLEVDIGEETPRQVVAGIALTHNPEDVKGRQVIVLANLKPAKLCGVKSFGMVLAGVDEAGEAILLAPEKEAKNGTQIG